MGNSKYIIAVVLMLFLSMIEANTNAQESCLINQEPLEYVSTLVGTQSK